MRRKRRRKGGKTWNGSEREKLASKIVKSRCQERSKRMRGEGIKGVKEDKWPRGEATSTTK